MKALFPTQQLQQVAASLIAAQQTIAVAESVTAGLLQHALATAENAAKFFQGGITAYNLGQKCRHLAIDPIHALNCDCVSESVAVTMAVNVAKRFTSHWGIGVTGYATPVPESGGQLFAWYAIAYEGEARWRGKLAGGSEPGLAAQLVYVHGILGHLQQALNNRHSGSGKKEDKR